MTQLTDKIWAVGIPDTVINFKQFTKVVKNEEADIPVGKFQFLFTTKAATEEDARKVVERYGKGWKDYNMYHAHKHIPYELAIDSLETLLRSKNLDPKNNYAIIEKLSSDGAE